MRSTNYFREPSGRSVRSTATGFGVDVYDTDGSTLLSTITAGFDVVNVAAEGAVGDGVTDDTAAIDAARTKALAAGKPVYFPHQTEPYRYVGSMIMEPNETILGPKVMDSSPRKATIKFDDGGIVANDHVLIENLWWQGSNLADQIGLIVGRRPAGDVPAGWPTDAARSQFVGCRVSDFDTGIYVRQAWVITFRDFESSHNLGNGIEIGPITLKVNFDGGDIAANDWGVVHTAGLSATFENMTIEGNTSGSVTTTVNDSLKAGILYSNCYFEEGAIDAAILITGRNTVGMTVRDCSFSGADYAVKLDVNAGYLNGSFGWLPGCSHFTFDGNTLTGGSNNGYPNKPISIGANAEWTYVGQVGVGKGSAVAEYPDQFDPAADDNGINTRLTYRAAAEVLTWSGSEWAVARAPRIFFQATGDPTPTGLVEGDIVLEQ